jgi:hypothetical protein
MKTLLKILSGISILGLVSCGNQDAFVDRSLNSASSPQFNDLVQYFSMDNANFNDGVTFFSNIGFNGTVKNPDGAGMVSTNGTVNTAVQFDGVNDRIVVPYINALNPNKFTVSAWVKISGADRNRCVVTSRDNAPARGYALCINGSAQPQVLLGQGGSANNWATATGTAIFSNVWTQLVVTYDGTNLRLYKNALLESSPIAAYVPNTSRPLYVGAGGTELDPAASDFFQGVLDEVAIWDTVLTAEDVSALFQKQSR